MAGAILSALGGVAGGIVNAIQNQQHHDDWLNWEKYKLQYNSIPNQLGQWKAAGLNPQTFNGNFVPAQGTPPQPNSLGNGIASSLQSAGSLWQQKQLAKLNNEVQRDKLELEKQNLEIQKDDAAMRKAMHYWNLKGAEQAWNRGEYAYAKDILDYTFAFATHDDRVSMLHNQKLISDTYQKNYTNYLGALIQNRIEQNLSLRHNRQIQDKRLVFDMGKHYDDDFYRWQALQDLNDYRAESLGLRSLALDETAGYHQNMLDFYRYQATMRARMGLLQKTPTEQYGLPPVNRKLKFKFR